MRHETKYQWRGWGEMAEIRTRMESGIGRESLVMSLDTSVPLIPVYEEQLSREPRWALSEGSRHFEEKSAVFGALYKITAKLEALGIPYAVVGGMALFRHGVRRFTEDVDLLVRRDDLILIHEKLSGLGYLPPFKNSKHLRDTELGVKIEFLKTGDFPGDGRPKPVAFPDPESVRFDSDGIRYINLPTLVELKLASGMTGAGRLKDLADVLELIKALHLPLGFADQLNDFVRSKYQELWSQARERYVTVWRKTGLTAEASSIEEIVRRLRSESDQLDQMFNDGVELELSDSSIDDYVMLVTTDPTIAEKYGMLEESEYWDRGEDGLR